MKAFYFKFHYRLLILIIAASTQLSANAQTTIIGIASSWKYLDNGSNQGTNWRTTSFNDASWSSGLSELGFGDSPTTVLSGGKIGYYFRKTVNIVNPSSFSNFTMKIRRDDGVVVYINNVEAYRNNMPTGTIAYNTKASSTCTDDGNTVFTANISSSLFTNGNNTIAVEVHNRSTSSGDISFELQLLGNGSSTSSCAIPNVNLFGVRNVTAISFEAFWLPIAGAQSYNIQYRIRNTGTYSASLNSITANIIITGLQPLTNYEFIVQSVCSSTSVSAFSPSGWVTTIAGQVGTCAIPNINLFGIRNLTASSAEAYWSPVTGSQSYNLQYRIRNSGAGYSASFNSTTAYFVMTGLQPATNYEFIVQTVCAGSSLSAYSLSGWFTTLNGTGSGTTLVRGPYMPIATSSGITIQWRTSTATNNEVKYGISTTLLNNTATNSTISTEHSVSLTELQANTKYFYSIGPIGSVLQGDASNFFYTAPVNGSTVPVKFWVTGDFGDGGANQLNVRNSFTNYTSGQILNGWIWLGDNAYTNGTDAQYQTNVFNVYNNQFKNMPIYPAPGNHDYAQVGYQSAASLGVNFPYFNIFTLPSSSGTEKYYSTNYANIHFISLDSYGAYNNSSSAMYTWLSNDLASNTQQWTIVYFHHPPYSKGSHNSDTESELIDMRQNIIPLLESYGVDVVLTGHSHIYERSYFIKNHTGLENTFNTSLYPAGNIIQAGGGPYTKTSRTGNGTVYVVCGVSGQAVATTLPGYPHNAMFKSLVNNNGSLILDVSGNNLTCKFLSSSGVIDDQFSMQKPSVARFGTEISEETSNPSESVPFIFPNPTTGDLHIAINNSHELKISISIFNAAGSLQFNRKYVKTSSENILIEKSETNLRPGIYIVNIIGENINTTNKLVVY